MADLKSFLDERISEYLSNQRAADLLGQYVPKPSVLGLSPVDDVFRAEERRDFAHAVARNPEILENEVAKYRISTDPSYPDRKFLPDEEVAAFRDKLVAFANVADADRALLAAYQSPKLTKEERMYFALRYAYAENSSASALDAFSKNNPVFGGASSHPSGDNPDAMLDAIQLERLKQALKNADAASLAPVADHHPGQMGRLDSSINGLARDPDKTLTR